METLSEEAIGELLLPYLTSPLSTDTCGKITRYLELLEHWNGRVSLTSVRDPAQVVQRHFGESLFLAGHLLEFGTLLDLGSGAGFPGIPVALVRPGIAVALAESQGKKAAFLREAVFELGLKTEVWADRVEKMPSSRRFDTVALRAVDNMELALGLAMQRLAAPGLLAFFAGEMTPTPVFHEHWSIEEFPVPLSSGRLIFARSPGPS